MSETKAGVVVVTKFCRSSSSTFSSYIDYIDREEAVREKNSAKYNLYQDYMGNPEKTTGLFTEQKDITSSDDKKDLKDIFKTAQEKGSLMWQTVISFDNEWLENNGLYKKEDNILDEERLKGITRSAVHKMLEKEGLQNAIWSAAIHYNTDNIHIHIATVEPEPMREKRDYIQYDYQKENGRIVKNPRLDANGLPITESEYKGTFKQSSIETCKREVVNQIINEKENNLKINSIIRESILKQKREHPLSKDRELVMSFLELYGHMPDCNRNMWNYNNPIMNPLHGEIDRISEAYLDKYHKDELDELRKQLKEQDEKYRQAYGNTDHSYADTKLKDLYTRLGNAILKEVREFDKETRESSSGRSGVTNDPLDRKGESWKQKQDDKKEKSYARTHIARGISVQAAIKRMKRGLKSEWEKARLEREHERMMQQARED